MKILHNGDLVTDLAFPASGELTNNGWLLGDGIFETLKSFDGKILALSRHLDRAFQSASILEIVMPERRAIEVGVATILQATSEIAIGRMRMTFLSSGDWVITHKALNLPSKPLSLIDYPYPKNQLSILAGVKTISYGESAHALRFASRAGFSDVIFKNTSGNVAESAVANILWESDSQFCTPPLSTGCLPGITRGLLLEQFNVIEMDITPEQLEKVTALYLLSSTREIQQVARYNNREFAISNPGQELIRSFSNWIRSNLEP